MKRELKPCHFSKAWMRSTSHCKAYPDEKGIETKQVLAVSEALKVIAKPIPMKRELKPQWA